MSIDTPTKEYHVASFVAQVVPSQLSSVKEAINAVDGAEVHTSSDEGKIVFTVESEYQKQIADKAESIKQISGVLTMAPVYHQYLTEE